MSKVYIPQDYHTPLSVYEMQRAIEFIKSNFQVNLSNALNLRRVSAPLFVDENSGLNDNLNGVERPVSFDIPDVGTNAQVVHSLAKWKRLALKRYDFKVGKGLFTDMNAIRRDEEVDNLHSIYVDQWDWEKVISAEDRNVAYLKRTVRDIVSAVSETSSALNVAFPSLHTKLPSEVFFITTQELEDLYPDLTPKQREDEICKKKGVVFLMQIGKILKSGIKHDGRAPDYDDWELNGVFPNTMKFSIVNSKTKTDLDVTAAQRMESKSVVELFADFYRLQNNDQPPSAAHMKEIEKTLRELEERP